MNTYQYLKISARKVVTSGLHRGSRTLKIVSIKWNLTKRNLEGVVTTCQALLTPSITVRNPNSHGKSIYLVAAERTVNSVLLLSVFCRV